MHTSAAFFPVFISKAMTAVSTPGEHAAPHEAAVPSATSRSQPPGEMRAFVPEDEEISLLGKTAGAAKYEDEDIQKEILNEDYKLSKRDALRMRRGITGGFTTAAVVAAATVALVLLVIQCSNTLKRAKQGVSQSVTSRIFGRRLMKQSAAGAEAAGACAVTPMENAEEVVLNTLDAMVDLARYSDPWGPMASATLVSENCLEGEYESMWHAGEAVGMANLEVAVSSSLTVLAKDIIALNDASRAIASYVSFAGELPEWFFTKAIPNARIVSAVLAGWQLRQSMQITATVFRESHTISLGVRNDVLDCVKILNLMRDGPLESFPRLATDKRLPALEFVKQSLDELGHRLRERRRLEERSALRLGDAETLAAVGPLNDSRGGPGPTSAQVALLRHSLTASVLDLISHAVNASNSLVVNYRRPDLAADLLLAYTRLAVAQMKSLKLGSTGPQHLLANHSAARLRAYYDMLFYWWDLPFRDGAGGTKAAELSRTAELLCSEIAFRHVRQREQGQESRVHKPRQIAIAMANARQLWETITPLVAMKATLSKSALDEYVKGAISIASVESNRISYPH